MVFVLIKFRSFQEEMCVFETDFSKYEMHFDWFYSIFYTTDSVIYLNRAARALNKSQKSGKTECPKSLVVPSHWLFSSFENRLVSQVIGCPM